MGAKCRICSCSAEHATFDAREMMYGSHEPFGYFLCTNCSCLQIDVIPENLAQYYPDDYYSKSTNFEDVINKPRTQKIIRSLAKYLQAPADSRLNFEKQEYNIIPALKMSRDDYILDVGCGTGRVIYTMKEAGFNNVFGTDPFIDDDIEYANGLKIYKQSIEAMPADVQWDFITFHHSFEHMINPHEVITSAKQRLSENGKIILSIPVLGYAWEKYGVDWYQLDAPRHICLHSQDSMAYLAKQHGLKIEKIIYDSGPNQFLKSEKYQQGISLVEQSKKSGGLRRLKASWHKMKYKRMSKALNESMNGDQAVFILSKI